MPIFKNFKTRQPQNSVTHSPISGFIMVRLSIFLNSTQFPCGIYKSETLQRNGSLTIMSILKKISSI